MELTVGDIVEALSAPERASSGQEIRDRLDGLLARLAGVLAEIDEGAPLPVDASQVERIAQAMRLFPALRRHRYVAHRLGIELRPL